MAGTLYIVGVGLGPGQITQEAINVLRSVGEVFIEEYTSMFETSLGDHIAKVVGRMVVKLSRRDLEEESGRVIINAIRERGSAALAVIGDPMLATTHSALVTQATQLGIRVRVINGISIVCAAVSQAGLSPYKLGPVATVTYERGGVLSKRAYEVLAGNISRGLHTPLLLDIKDEGGFMSIREAVDVLIRLEDEVKQGIVSDDLAAVFESRIGWSDQAVVVASLTNPPDLKPPSVILIPGLLNPVEEEYLRVVHGAGEELLRRHVNHVKALMRTMQHSSG
ncbi:MAG: diphthine synthase [Caldivirga sp.]|jgi:diphthine synthase